MKAPLLIKSIPLILGLPVVGLTPGFAADSPQVVCVAEIVGKAGKISVESLEGEIFHVAPNESLSIALKVPAALIGQVVQIRSDDGGTIQRDGDADQPLAQESTLRLTYTIGPDAGRYILKFRAPGFSQTMEFWAGPLPPQGLPGPPLTFPRPPANIPSLPNTKTPLNPQTP